MNAILLPRRTSPSTEIGTSLAQAAREDLAAYAEAMRRVADGIGDEFDAAVDLMFKARGRVILCALGKSGHICRKAAATLASTGTPALFLHASEALHGDIGMTGPGDVVILVSHSGETAEVLATAAALDNMGLPLIGVSRSGTSSLARSVAVHITVDAGPERCPIGAAPTTSAAATLAVLDTLALALMRLRNFNAGDFARRHPGGSLGAALAVAVGETL